MLKIGIICSREKEAGEIAQTARLAAVREGLICEVCVIQKEFFDRELEGSRGTEPDGTSCLILSWECRQEAFGWAEMLWGRNPRALLLYVAHSTDDIFAALQMPFFHTVRAFDLEQDLETAFRKLGRLKVPSSEKTGFTWGGKVMHIYRRDILYLESEHHDIHLHTLGEILSVAESLSQCEQKLKNQGFARIHRSFLVNMYHIRCLEKSNVLLDNGERLYISRQRYPEVKFQFENYIRHLDFI